MRGRNRLSRTEATARPSGRCSTQHRHTPPPGLAFWRQRPTFVIASVSEAIQDNEWKNWISFRLRQAATADRSSTAVIPRLDRGIQYAARFRSITDASEYWIVRRSLSSGAHSRDPVADDDEHGYSRDALRPSFANSLALKKERRSATLKRGRREDRVRAAPEVSCAKVANRNAHEHTGSAEAVRPSLRNGFNSLFRALPGETRACLSPSPA
jgi:hypothetical protein